MSVSNEYLLSCSNWNAQGAEVQVDQDHLAFGAVVQRCQTSKRIVMMNTGDIGARWG